MPFDERLAQRVREVLGKECAAQEKRMFGGLAFMVNGHMCCGIVGEDLVVRVGAEGHELALSQPHVRAMDFTGRPLRGFIYVAREGFRTNRTLKTWVKRGLHYVEALPPK